MADHDHEALAAVYGAESPAELERGYAGWAARYDSDLARWGYQTPQVTIGYAARHVPADAGPVIDIGAGTGIAGALMRLLGYADLTGIDLSEEMLAVADSRGVYRALRRQVLGQRLDFADGAFAAAIATGVFTDGHAPPGCLGEVARIVRPGGVLAFSLKHGSASETAYRRELDALAGAARLGAVEESPPFRSFTLAEETVFSVVLVYRVL